MKYKSYRYIYPTRPKNAIPSTDLEFWDNNTLIGQPKLDGSNTLIFTDGLSVRTMNRHNSVLTGFNIPKDEILNLHRGVKGQDWIVLNGEYLNKSKRDENGKLFNNKLCIFDILVYKSDYMIGSTFMDRLNILHEIYGENDSDKFYLNSISENVYMVKSYFNGFKSIYDSFSGIDVVEGLVMKRINAKLEIGNTSNNNTKSILKCRVKTKNYKF